MRLMRDFKETFRSRNALKDSGLRAGIRIAFTDYGQGCATDCAGQRLPDWGIYSGPATFFPFGDRAPRPSVHPGQQRPKGCLRRVPVRKRKSCVFAGTVHKRHLPGGAGEALSKRPRRGGLSGFPPAGCRAATLSAMDSQGSSPTTQFKCINSSVLSFLHSPTLTSIHDWMVKHR